MIGYISVVATFPFMLHLLTAGGVLYGASIQENSMAYWVDLATKCYSIAPPSWTFSRHLAYLQACLAIAAFCAHLSNKLEVRKVGYGLLLIVYGVTQLRHLLCGHATDVISYLHTHIAIFAFLVLYNDARLYNDVMLVKEKTDKPL